MRLRALAVRLRQQDWTAVTIEILILIVGVFIQQEARALARDLY